MTDRILFLTSHVDDLALFASTVAIVNWFKERLSSAVKFTDHGDMKLLLGMTIKRNLCDHTISFSHAFYIDAILDRFNMAKCNPVSTPIDPSADRLSRDQSPQTSAEHAEMAKVPYAQAVGALMHLAVMSRPDISHAVQRVSQFMQDPGVKHWEAVKRILRYLKGTRDLCLTLGGPMKQDFEAWSDSDFAGSPDHAKSITGYALFFGRGPFAWASRKQTAIADSTRTAEYFAAHACGREVVWFRLLMENLGIPPSGPTLFHLDNQAAESNINSDALNASNRSLKVNWHWIQAMAQEKQIQTVHVPSKENCADMFTKGFGRVDHQALVQKLGMVVVPVR